MLCYVFRPLFRTNRIIGIRILWGENSLVRLGLISVFFIVLLITFLVTFPPTGVQPSWHPLYTIFPGQHKNGESAQEMTQVADLWDSPPVRSSSHLRFLTIVTLFKDERPRLREWIEFNIGTGGVDHFVLYDHGSTDEPLEILQYYINEGKVTYIPWPPQSIPPPPPFNTRLEESQYSIFKDNLEACIDKTDTVHKQASCQKSAVSHCAIYHGKGGGTRWLAFLDVDEFLFPRPMSKYKSVAEILRQQYPGTDHLIIVGINFGPSEHINHAARPAPGSPLPALIIESYTRRPELGSDIWNSQWASSITKAIANPDMISHSEIHRFVPPDNTNWVCCKCRN